MASSRTCRRPISDGQQVRGQAAAVRFALIEPRWHGKNVAVGRSGTVGSGPSLNVRRHDGRRTMARLIWLV